MGNVCASADQQEKDGKSNCINQQLAVEAKTIKSHIKLLLLGAGECGKSTILKQMKILHKNGFTDEEVDQQKAAVYSNTVTGMYILLVAMHDLDIPLDLPDRDTSAQVVFNVMRNNEQSEPFSDELKDALKDLWTDQGVREAYARRAEFQLFDAANYFFDSVDRVGLATYSPTETDILYVRVKTIGIVETNFTIKGMFFRVFDVGGQRSERRKWIHCFDDCNAIIYIAAISEYDQVLDEDNKTNRLKESLELFSSICNSEWFTKTSMILFLNKKDLFEEKIMKIPLTVCFESYTGIPEDYDSAVIFLEDRFEAVNHNKKKNIYTHQTCATDTNQVQIVLDSVFDMVVAENVHGSGLA